MSFVCGDGLKSTETKKNKKVETQKSQRIIETLKLSNSHTLHDTSHTSHAEWVDYDNLFCIKNLLLNRITRTEITPQQPHHLGNNLGIIFSYVDILIRIEICPTIIFMTI